MAIAFHPVGAQIVNIIHYLVKRRRPFFVSIFHYDFLLSLSALTLGAGEGRTSASSLEKKLQNWSVIFSADTWNWHIVQSTLTFLRKRIIKKRSSGSVPNNIRHTSSVVRFQPGMLIFLVRRCATAGKFALAYFWLSISAIFNKRKNISV